MWLTTDQFNFVMALPPAMYDSTVTTNFPCVPVNMGKYDSMVAIVGISNPTTCNIWMNCYATLSTVSGAGVSIKHLDVGSYRQTATSATAASLSLCDTLTARTALATTAIILTVASTTAYTTLIEVKNSDMPAGYPYLAVSISTGATASSGMAVYYIMKPRYLNKDMVTAIS
jgi:hypothetical protein